MSGITALQAQTWDKAAGKLLKPGQEPLDTGKYTFNKTLAEMKMEALNFF